MKALYIRQHGPISELRVSEIQKPTLKPGEVLVQVEAAGINPSDLGSVQGRFAGSVLPRVVGRDFAGVIMEGPDDLVGKKVWGSGGDLGITRDGTHAEYLAVPRQAATLRPKNLSAEEAAVTGVPFVTAYSAAFRRGGLKKGEWVIVTGAAGAVGQAAIQLAHHCGASVVALVRDASQHGVAQSAGVQAVAQSDRDDLAAVVREATKDRGADLALNGIGANVSASLLASLAPGGRQVVYSAAGGRDFTLDILNFYQRQLSFYGVSTSTLDATACAGILNEIAPLFESGALAPPKVNERFPLAQAAQAYGRVAEGNSGKVVLVMTPTSDVAPGRREGV